MFITDLRIETHHLNRVLVIRLYGDPIVSAHNGMLWPVEDLQKNLAIVTLHNWHADPEEMCQLFNEDLVVAIKQPYFELCNRGGLYNVGIDHISDVHVLPVSHPMIARFYTEEERDKRCKKASKSGEGPAMTVSARRLILQQRDATVTLWTPTHLHRKMPKSRISGYSRGARKPTPGSATSTTPSSALKITTYRKNGTQNGRIEYLKANALHNLGKHRDCWMILECLDHLDELAELLHKAASMWLELWQAQTRPLDPNSTRTSYVDFTTIEEHEDGKPGLFAKRDFRANEIVLIERPLFVSKPERADRKFCIVDLEDR
ncbi:uncharacterized protein BDZ99DRAFT_465348 [Mytilinidion resinicola]|uniref:Uncharacterized protein n=1 Tax=Mytilinidion resinicola TaxID=574789 RepID=A0A6A6YHK2_9PEZI|nr:uncharacterized protein BDZ99DRAFT_465348 [Mytilinidion resinicola]KAF2807485.1 hypothetical protein BDZ99DRAFT_465348 [Mytilinidion resinicola]